MPRWKRLPADTGEVSGSCQQTLTIAGQPLLDRAQHTGEVRGDVTMTDLLVLVGAVSTAAEQVPDRRAGLLDILIGGLTG